MKEERKRGRGPGRMGAVGKTRERAKQGCKGECRGDFEDARIRTGEDQEEDKKKE